MVVWREATPSLAACLVILLVGPALFVAGEEAADVPETIRLSVLGDGWEDAVLLQRTDLRTPEAQAMEPGLALGHYAGVQDESGGIVHLVWNRPDSAALVAGPQGELVWMQVVGDSLRPLPVSAMAEPEHAVHPEPLTVPEAAPSGGALQEGVDGVLQVTLERDWPLVQRLGQEGSLRHAMDIVFLAETVYAWQLGITFEVVETRFWSGPDPYGGAETGSQFLRAVRDYQESVRPTLSHEREVHHTFSGRFFSGVNGVAYVGQLETPWAYGYHSHRVDLYGFAWPGTVPHPGEVATTAHEIGHNFDGRHELATPTPGGPLDVGGSACTITKYGTLLFPCGVVHRVWRFSEVNNVRPVMTDLGVAKDGGNAPRMSAYAAGRI